MKLRHRRLISIITSFIMAVTVFGCTSLTFAANEDDAVQATDIESTATDTINDDEGTNETPEGSQSDDQDQKENTVKREVGDENPAAPDKVNETSGDKTVTLEWSPVVGPNGGDISYEIYDSEDATEPIETTTATNWGKTDLAAGTYTYYIGTVETVTVEGEDVVVLRSETRTQFGPLEVTDEAADFANQRLTGLISDPGYRAVLLEWNKVEGATGYLIYRRQGGERGNTDSNCRDSNASNKYNLMTFKSSKSKGYGVVKKPGSFTLVKDYKGVADSNGKINYRDPNLPELNMTYVYFYQYVIVPYRQDAPSDPIEYCLSENGTKITDKTKDSISFYGTNVNYNTVKNNTVLPMYVLYKVKVSKPYYRTNSMKDGKKMGRLSKGTYYIGFDKKDGRDRFYMAKSGTSRTEWWFAQKNAGVVQGYYLNNGNAQNLNRKDWAYGYSKKTVLDYVNNARVSSKTNYLIWVSKYAQHAYIFYRSNGKWVLINGGKDGVTTGSTGYWSNLCASGKVVFNSRNNNGPIYGKQYRAKRSKYWYYNLSKLHSTERLHSVLYKKKAAFGSGKYYDKTLGIPKSNGCIRLKPGASQFIYKKVPVGTKVLVY